MNDNIRISRRAFAGGVLVLGLGRKTALAQGFAGLGMSGEGFAPVTPGKTFAFPADHGPHPDYRIEWWYVTANLVDSAGVAYGAQWTLFRQATTPGAQQEGWANQQIWMREETIAPLELNASGTDFSYALRLDADRPLVLQGDAGYSKKSERGQASYYFSQPYFKAAGSVTIDDKPHEVAGLAWMDREWSSQPLASDQTGWDWLSLHLTSGEKLMLYRLRQKDGHDDLYGNWIEPAGRSIEIASTDNSMTPTALTEIEGRKIPTAWRIAIPSRSLTIECVPLNPRSWMGTSFPYWEGPISFKGSHYGLGYLEMTGY